MDIATILMSVLPSLFVGIVLAVWNQKQNNKEKEVEKRADTRKKESLLNINLTAASAQLSFACAMAIKRGAPNGEVEVAIVSYNKAMKEYQSFLNSQAMERINEGRV